MEQDNKKNTNILEEPSLVGMYESSQKRKSGVHSLLDVPCTYTDDEFKLLLREAERGGFVSDDAVRNMFMS